MKWASRIGCSLLGILLLGCAGFILIPEWRNRVAVSLLSAIFGNGRNPAEDKRKVEQEEGIQVTATQLRREFEEKKDKATEKYIGKVLQVEGRIAQFENESIWLQVPFKNDPGFFSGTVCCFEKRPALVPNQLVVIKGVCTGTSFGTWGPCLHGSPVLQHCKLIRAEPEPKP